ncbi:MAG: flavocytochrome c [Clostridia bacterium]|nr:flavocytochrome c [Clostridia bacterium]
MKRVISSIAVVAIALSLIAGVGLAQVADGVYTGQGMGNGGVVTVSVTFAGGSISAIEITEHSETAGLGDVALERMADAILSSQSLAIDTVSGATLSSNAIIAAVAEAITAAGGDADGFMVEYQAAEIGEAENQSADLVVVGAGGAGMVAALQAVQDGVKDVVIVEKLSIAGGNTVRSTGGMNASETPEQAGLEFAESAGVTNTLESASATYGEELAELIATVQAQYDEYQNNPEGYFDTDELFQLDTLVGGRNLNDPELVKVLSENAKDGIEWLHTIGADLTSVGAFGGASVKRIHRPVNEEGRTVSVGSFIVPVLLSNCEESVNIDIIYDTRATELTMQDGKVNGVKVVGPEGEYIIYADAVILATGGFGANEEMYVQYRPDLEGFVTTNAPGATGDGIVMGQAVGAAVVDIEQIQIHPTVEQNTSALITEGLRGDGAILVNQEGQRFTDEVGTRDVVSAAVIAQTGSYAYLIVDQKMVDASTVIAGYITRGFTKQGDTYAQLASELNMDAAAFEETMAQWNQNVANGEDGQFGRTSFANALDTAPFYAIQIAPGVHHTMGGLKIDSHACVISTDGEEIPGLYAAGEVTGGVHGANRLGGNAVADIVVFGRIAGSSAAEMILQLDEAA